MENLKRYGPALSESGFATMQKIDNGGWVKFSDIKELLQTSHNSESKYAEQICSQCVVVASCSVRKSNQKVKGCAYMYE
jgi:hypothetical protein